MSDNNEKKKNKLPLHFILVLLPLVTAIVGVPGAFVAPNVAKVMPSIVKVAIKICMACVMLGIPISIFALKKLKEAEKKQYMALTILFAILDMAGSVLFIYAFLKYMIF